MSRRVASWTGRAIGMYRLLLEQQGCSGQAHAVLIRGSLAGQTPAALPCPGLLGQQLQAASLRTVAYDPAARTAVLRWQLPSDQLRWLRLTGYQLLQHETAVKTKLTQAHQFPHLAPGSHIPPRDVEPGRQPVDLADAGGAGWLGGVLAPPCLR